MTVFSPSDVVFARPELHTDPLVHHVPAWLHLIAPATAAKHFTKLYAPLFEGFLQNPEVHRTSARNPKLRGGMFVNLEDDALDKVRSIVSTIRAEDGPYERLATGLDALDAMLRER